MPYSINFSKIRIRPGTSRKLSMPNQWARSHRLQCQPDISTQTINVKSIDTILYLFRKDEERITLSP